MWTEALNNLAKKHGLRKLCKDLTEDFAKHPRVRVAIEAVEGMEPDPNGPKPTDSPPQGGPRRVFAVSLILSVLVVLYILAPGLWRQFVGCTPRFKNEIYMEFVLIPRGSFKMGSPKDEPGRLNDEGSRHDEVISASFYIAVHETTQRQYAAVLGRNPSYFAPSGEGRSKLTTIETDDFPVESITYLDAIEFCIMLSEREKLTPCYRLADVRRGSDGSIAGAKIEFVGDGNGYRLPTETEWEYCARAGTSTSYWFGDTREQLADCGWFDENSGGSTNPVGKKKQNKWGLFDVAGQAWEWCDSPCPAKPGFRVRRGGSWNSFAQACRSASHSCLREGDRDNETGFRVIREIAR
jgi:formylglycine-generating enzyme required for sulfatase activity